MYCLLVLSKTALFKCLVVTFPASIIPSFMYWILVLSETSYIWCLLTTSITGIFHILVQIVIVNYTLSFDLILILVTGKHVSIITAEDQLVKES
jgi:hypothetical protein